MTEAARTASPQRPPESPSAEVLPRRFGRYALVRGLASGGMAVLYLALHRSIAGIERLVVIKRILPEYGRDRGYIEMLLKEARIAMTFAHPNIVTVFDVGQVDGEYYIAMEHIHGEDLRSVVRAMKPKGVTEFPLEHALGIGVGTAAGLAYAHEKRDLEGKPLRVVHRDVSPQNIVVTFTGDVKVVDFGIAKASLAQAVLPSFGDDERGSAAPGTDTRSGEVRRGERETHTSLNSLGGDGTGPGKVKGKVPYMSPEQARGEDLDHRSDIFSLGIILFELCTGRRLFRGGSEADTLKMITDGDYPRPSDVNPRVSPALESVIMKALAPDRDARYQSARELQADLESVARDARLPVSAVALGAWMKMLFAERLAEQDAALAAGRRRLAELIGDAPTDDREAPRPSQVAPEPAAPPRPRNRLAAVAAVALLALAAVALLKWRGARGGAAERAAAATHAGVIAVRSTPPGAHVWLNDAPTSFRTPHDLAGLATGPRARYRVRVTAEGYEPYAAEVPLASPGARAEVTATLARARASAFAALEVSTTPPGARVLVDGREQQGSTPLTVSELEPGVEHAVVVRSPEHAEESFTFVGAAGRVEARALTLRERPLGPGEAWLVVTTEPASAAIRVGDRDYATGSPYRLRVAASPRPLAVTASAPGYLNETRYVRAPAGQTATLRTMHLPRLGPATPARAPAPAAPAPTPPPADATPATIRVGSNPWCEATVDGRPYGQTPTAPITLAPGRHTVRCTNPERGTRTQEINLSPGQRLGVRIDFSQ